MNNVNKNRKAFLDMIAHSEGTAGHGDDGYNVMVGGKLFDDYSKHPHPRVYIKSIDDYSTASGRYQLLYKYWLYYSNTLKLDKCVGGAFGHDAQDRIAIQQIIERKALKDVDAGNFKLAVDKCASIWASLPGGCQHKSETTMSKLEDIFEASGGVLNIGV